MNGVYDRVLRSGFSALYTCASRAAEICDGILLLMAEVEDDSERRAGEAIWLICVTRLWNRPQGVRRILCRDCGSGGCVIS